MNKSVFTREDTSFVSQMNGPALSQIPRLVIHESDVLKLLQKLDENKAIGLGPDNILCRLLLNLSIELAPIITSLLTQSLETGTVPKDWTGAFWEQKPIQIQIQIQVILTLLRYSATAPAKRLAQHWTTRYRRVHRQVACASKTAFHQRRSNRGSVTTSNLICSLIHRCVCSGHKV